MRVTEKSNLPVMLPLNCVVPPEQGMQLHNSHLLQAINTPVKMSCSGGFIVTAEISAILTATERTASLMVLSTHLSQISGDSRSKMKTVEPCEFVCTPTITEHRATTYGRL